MGQAGYPAVHDILIHPGYAGVFAYGRSKLEKHLNAGGNVITRQRRLPRDQWAVMIPGHHPGYISLETYDANIARLAANSPPPACKGRRRRARRRGLDPGPAALRPVRTAHAGQLPLKRQPCLPVRTRQPDVRRDHLPAGRRRAAAAVLAELLAALAPACLAATIQAMSDTEAQFRQNLAVFERALERARFEASRAHRQYDNIEPENRLVPQTLEAVLEDKLTAVRTAENQLAAQQAPRPVTLTEEETAWITTAGADLRAIFQAPATTNTQRKELIRAVITGVPAISWTFPLCCFWCPIVKLALVIRWAYLAEPTLFRDVIVISLDVVEHGGPDLARVAAHGLIDQPFLDVALTIPPPRCRSICRCARPTG